MLKENKEDNNHKEEMTNSWNEYKLDSQTLKFVKRERKISFSWSVKSKRKHSVINNADDCSLPPLLEPCEIHFLHFLKGP